MREGVHPAKEAGDLPPFGPHRLVIPVHIPHLDGYFTEARAVLARCLDSVRLTAGGQVAVTLVSDGSCPEVLADLRAAQDAGWVDQVVVNQPNRGKVDSVLAVARASFEPLVTISDADILFRPGWVAAVEELFTTFPECGFASLFPSPPGAFHLTSATLLGALSRRELQVGSVVDEDDLDRFAASIGRPDLFPEEWRRHQLLVRRAGVTACVGAPHWVLTLRRAVIDATPPEPSRRAVGGSETRWLDEPADRIGLWRLATSRAYAQHMGNVVEPWMDDELEATRAAVDGGGDDPADASGPTGTPRAPITPHGRIPLAGRLPWPLRARVADRLVRPRLERRIRQAGGGALTVAARAALRRADRWARAAARRSSATWRWGLNAGPTLAYRRSRPVVTSRTAGLVADLDRDGIATVALDDLVGTEAAATFLTAADRARRERTAAVDTAREALARGDDGPQKPFVVGLLEGPPSTDPDDALTGFALDPAVLAVVHGYYAMFVRLRYVDIWHTLVVDAPPTQSQLWHRDPEDRLILKVFVTLEDVDEGAGPFHYAPGTHAKGSVRRRPAASAVDGTTPRSTDDQMAEVLPSAQWRTAIAPRGTVVFADTRGYHKGGHAVAEERVLYVCQYLSRAAGRGGIPTDQPAPRR